MSATATKPAVRWSSSKTCPRKAVYEAQDAPARERTERESRILFRGKSVGRDYADLVAAKHCDTCRSVVAAGQRSVNHEGCVIQRERKVPWAAGVGHVDFYVYETRTPVEVLSTQKASAEMIESKLLQLAGYAVNDPQAGEIALLVIVDPVDMSEERITLRLNDDWRERVQAVTAKVLAALETGELPERVCRKPTEARGRFCQFAEHCFADWTPEPLPIQDDPQTRTLVTELYKVSQRAQPLKDELSRLATERKNVEAQLVDVLEPGSYVVGPLRLTRTAVERKPTLDLRKAELAGFPVETLSEWMKAGASFSTFKVERVSDEPLTTTDSFGEEPF